ncbi:hypothetical protein C2S52_021290 [Perilla frutescens var. hirtella]|uniref:DUF8204 domain-containing protein n=1 Tax=Perilla frutescens var. hirtella TaxID=608512 RepID=A0AAD4JJY9_PERFH|nr:hypothetical protein C2S52_021290 [Perilla frutescens var. hirtella]KAH6835172.1 hypothetical protein C2S53_004972 [Perilla frutescens var. hirtella]
MVEPSKPEDWSNPKHAPEIWLEGETETMKSGASTKNTNSNTAVKSCKGLVYYSSRLKADSKNPICAGFTRSHRDLDEVSVDLGPVLIKHLPKEERTKTLSKFRVACVGYSAYSDRKGDHNFNGQETETELPGCMGFMVLMHKQPFFNKDGTDGKGQWA